MITALRAELKKIRGRFLWALPLVVVGMEFLWMMSNSYLAKPEASAEGYFNLLFQLPLLNTIFLPLILAVMASRICDAENKGNTYKLLCTMQEKKKDIRRKAPSGRYLYPFPHPAGRRQCSAAWKAAALHAAASHKTPAPLPCRALCSEPGAVSDAADSFHAHNQPAHASLHRASGQPGRCLFRLLPCGKRGQFSPLGLLHGRTDSFLLV